MRDITLAETIYIFFTTRAFATGIPTVLAGSPVVSAYENDSVTQITAGITLGVSHDSVVGLNLLTIVATGGNGFEASKDYTLVITTGTVGGVSVVGEVVGEFTIGRSAAATDLANGTDGLGALKAETAAILADTDAATWTTQMADSTVADGTIPTREQALLFLTRFLMERSVTTTAVTVRKEDGSTTVATFTLNDAANPTSITRAS